MSFFGWSASIQLPASGSFKRRSLADRFEHFPKVEIEKRCNVIGMAILLRFLSLSQPMLDGFLPPLRSHARSYSWLCAAIHEAQRVALSSVLQKPISKKIYWALFSSLYYTQHSKDVRPDYATRQSKSSEPWRERSASKREEIRGSSILTDFLMGRDSDGRPSAHPSPHSEPPPSTQ